MNNTGGKRNIHIVTQDTDDTMSMDQDDRDEELDHFGSDSEEGYSSDDSIGDELAKYYHDNSLLSPKHISMPTVPKNFFPSPKEKKDFDSTFSLTETRDQSSSITTSESSKRKTRNKNKEKKKENQKQFEKDVGTENEESSTPANDKEALTQVQVRKYFGTEARETFHKKVHWLNKQGAAANAALNESPKNSTLAGFQQSQNRRGNRHSQGKKKSNSNSTSALPPLRAQKRGSRVNRNHATRNRNTINKTKEQRPSFSSMFFDDMNDLDSSQYVNQLDAEADLDQTSTQEFIKRSKRALRNSQHRDDIHHSHHQFPQNSIQQVVQQQNSLLEYANNRTAASLKQIESLRAQTPDLHTMPSEGKGLSKIDSPRSTYIVGCLSQQLNPRASLIIRKDLTHEFHLAGMGMGDKMAVEFARSIRSIPVVHRINVEDNNLTDKGMKAILESIVTLPNLLELNLSCNKIGMKTAKALQSYLTNSSSCKLGRLILRNANVDDFEGEMFVTALKGNQYLKELDLSQNLIGQSEMTVRTAAKKGNKTATRSIADHLMEKGCCLEILRLSWNSIRLDSGVCLAKAIAFNKSLRVLDLSYNAIGSDGGQIIGESLYENKTMESLNLANNNIDGEACFVICAATEHNFTLKELNLDGNPIGEMGAKSIMNIPGIIGSRCEISCLGCNTGLRPKAGAFDEMEPFGEYDLDLSVPYQRAVACRVLSIVCRNRTYYLPTCIYSSSPIKGNEPTLDLEQKYVRDQFLYATKKDKKRIKMLHRLRLAAADVDKATELFNEFDIDHSGMIDKHEFQLLLQSLGVTASQSIVEKCMFLVDVDGSGQIELNELLAFFQASAKDAEKKIGEMIETTAMCTKNASGEFVRYVPPAEGFMKISIDRGHSRKPIFQVITAPDQLSIIKLANKLGDITTMIRYALQHTKLRLAEAISFYEVMLLDNGDKNKILHYLLPRVLLPAEAQQLISHVTLENSADISFLRQSMGNAIRPILGTPCGFYVLDLSKDMDRVCLHRLMEISATANLFRIQEKPSVYTKGCFGDTSMHGNFSFFRNEMFNGAPTIISPANFIPLPSRGLLEFDFAGDFRPLLDQHVHTMSDQKCTKILINLALLSITDKDKNLQWLEVMRAQSQPIPSSVQGYERYSAYHSKRTSHEAAEIQDAQTLFYSKLIERKEFLKMKNRNEEIKVDYVKEKTQNELLSSQSSQFSLDQMKCNDSSEYHLESQKTKKKIVNRTISLTMEDPFMQTDHSPTREAMRGVVERTLEKHSMASDSADSEDEGDSKVSLMALEKVVCNMETENKNGGFVSKQSSFPKKSADNPINTVALQEQRNKNRKTLKRMNSQFVDGVTKNRRKLRDLMVSKGVHGGAKIKKLVSCLVEAVGSFWIEARHLANLIHCFPLIQEDEIHTYGSYKVDLVVMLFSRVVDVHNFDIILSRLSTQEVGAIYCRLGWLNLFNPLKIQGAFDINLSVYEERLMCKAIVLHAMAEDGDNMGSGKFQWERKDVGLSGWMLTDIWLKDATMPSKGYVSFTYTPTWSGSTSKRGGLSSSGERMLAAGGAEKIWREVMCPLQRALLSVVLIDEHELMPEKYLLNNGEQSEEYITTVGDAYLLENIDAWAAYLYPPTPASTTTTSSKKKKK